MLRRPTTPISMALGKRCRAYLAALAALAGAGCLQVTDGFVVSPAATTGVAGGPQANCNPDGIVFPPTAANQFASSTVTCTNTGSNADDKNLIITIGGTGEPVFNAQFGTYPSAGLSPGQKATISVNYAPVTVSDDEGALMLNTNAGTVTIPLVGYGLSPRCQLSVPTAALDFGSVGVGQTKGPVSFAISNTGQTDCQIEAPIGMANDPSNSFKVVSASIQPIGSQYSLSPPGGATSRLVIQVSFTPKVKGNLTASVGDFASVSGTGE